jgi:hypothetical protein
MFALISKFIRTRHSGPATTAPAAVRGAMFEPLEGRQLYSVSSLGQLPAVQQPTAVERLPAVQLPAVQQPAGTNIIAILIGL